MVEEVDGRSSPGADGGPSAEGADGGGVVGPAESGASGTAPGGGAGSLSPASAGGQTEMVDSTFGRQTTVRPPPEAASPGVTSKASSSASAHASSKSGKGAGKRPPPPTSLPQNLREGGGRKGEEAEEGKKGEGGSKKTDKSPGLRTRSNQRWMKLRTTVQLSGAISSTIQKKTPLKREDSFLKRFSTRQIPETQETMDTGDDGDDGGSSSAGGGGGGGGNGGGGCGGGGGGSSHPASDERRRRRRRVAHHRRRPVSPRSVINPDENFYFYWLFVLTACVLYNLWTLIVRQSFPELQAGLPVFWRCGDAFGDAVFLLDVAVQFRTGYLEQGLMVYDSKKLAAHYIASKAFLLDLFALAPLDLVQLSPRVGTNPILRFPRFLKMYRLVDYYYMVESRTVYPNLWRVVNLVHILLILAHWFGCFYYLLSEAEGFQGDWVYPHRLEGDYATLTRKYLGSLYWSTLTLTTIGDLPTPETNADGRYRKAFSTLVSSVPSSSTSPPSPLSPSSSPANISSYANSSQPLPANTTTATATSADNAQALPTRRGLKSRLLQFSSNRGYVFTIVSYLIGVFIFATIVGQVGNVITNRNANRLEFERLLDGAKTYMRHHKVPGDMKRRVLRWYDYSWSRGRIQGGGDINTALGLLPDKLKTELALHVNLSVLKKVTIFQECQPEFLHDLVLKMKAYIFTPGDLICRKGEVAREMFIIADGILEVMSETGRVLTTMKAGDFFGEIGILNLDGLNKRTADVRSVGYSELFSLSREDVLAAMKDYPEAQEILQALGRKRLMEARNTCGRGSSRKALSRSSTKVASTPSPASTKSSPPALGKGNSKDEMQLENEKKESGLQHQASSSSSSPAMMGTSRDHSVDADSGTKGKRIVERLKSDVMGLREVLRKSKRIATRGMGDEAIELQPLTKETSSTSSMTTGSAQDKSPQLKALLLRTLTSKHTGNWDSSGSCSGIKGALRRMSHVKSDDSGGDASCSKTSPPEQHRVKRRRSRTKGNQDSEEADGEGEADRNGEDQHQKVEVIGEGLPLITRLRMLREKEERERIMRERRKSSKEESEIEKVGKDPPKERREEQETKPVEVIGEGLPLFTRLRMLREKEEREAAAERKAGQMENGGKKKANVMAVAGSSHSSTPPVSEVEDKSTLAKSEEKPVVRAGRPLIQRLLLLKAKEEKEKQEKDENPPSTVCPHDRVIDSVSTPICSVTTTSMAHTQAGNVDNVPVMAPTSTTTTASQISVAVVPPRTRDLNQSECEGKRDLPCVDRRCSDHDQGFISECSGEIQETCTRTTVAQVIGTTAQTSAEDSVSINQDVSAQSMCASDAMPCVIVQVEAEEVDEGEMVGQVSEGPDNELCCAAIDRKQEFRSSKPNLLQLRGDKNYVSIDDLSPEYSGLPFVKKLKILNDRQRLAELDKSSSLDSGSCSERPDPCYHNLSRSFSEASYISQICPPIASSGFGNHDSPNTLSLVKADASDCDDDDECPGRTKEEDLRGLSPESNETLERRNLKSILKKLSGSLGGDDDMAKSDSPKSEGTTNTVGATRRDLFQLMRAPTVEGYAARHSKLTKSVTFNRDTLASPPRTPTTPSVTPSMPLLYTPELPISVLLEKPQAGKEPSPLQQSSISTLKPASLSSSQEKRHLFPQGAMDSHAHREEEYFEEVILGIKQVIQSHLEEIQNKFQERFLSLESEVKRRDEIISFLQKRIKELEEPTIGTSANGNTISVEDNSTSSSDEINPFMRGDSADTVVRADLEDESIIDKSTDSKLLDHDNGMARQRSKRSCKRKSTHALSGEVLPKDDDARSTGSLSIWLGDRDGDLKMSSFTSTSSSSSSFTTSSSSSSPSSSSQEENYDDQITGRNKDWEVQMLARELERRQGVRRLKEEDDQSDKVDRAECEEEELESHHRLARRFLRLSRSERELLERLLGSEEDADEEETENRIEGESTWHQSKSLKQIKKKVRKNESRRKGTVVSRRKNGIKTKSHGDSKVLAHDSCQESDVVDENKKRKVWIGQQVLNARSLEETGTSGNLPSSSSSASRRRAASTGQLPFLLPLPSLAALSNSFRGIAKAASSGVGQISSQIPEPDPEKAVVTISGSGHSSSDCPIDTTVASEPSHVPKL